LAGIDLSRCAAGIEGRSRSAGGVTRGYAGNLAGLIGLSSSKDTSKRNNQEYSQQEPGKPYLKRTTSKLDHFISPFFVIQILLWDLILGRIQDIFRL
jgi:hypothetical protein